MAGQRLWVIGILFLAVTHNNPLASESDRQIYRRHCADCHSESLRGSAHGSPLSGEAFIKKWRALGVDALYKKIVSSMPPGNTGRLSDLDYQAIQRHILEVSEIVQATTKNPAETSPGGRAQDHQPTLEAQPATPSLQGFVAFSDANTVDQLNQRETQFNNRQVKRFTSVDDAALAQPAAADWPSWRRTLDGQGYSPLATVNRDNVGDLRLAWSMSMNQGSNQGTPLVSQGIMFVTHPGNVIQALDATNGDLIWTFKYDFPDASRTLGGPTRNIALYGDKLFMATYDAALIAIDVRTGKLVWRTVKADYRDGLTHTSGPIVANGVIVSGINGCERFVVSGCFITGHDPETGEELWRTSTIALPGDPNSNSWGDLEPTLRAGGDTWIPGSYDAALNLFYIGTSQAKPWVAASRGMTPHQAALYTNSTLAIDPNTGAIAWHFQHVPGETIDMEVGFERILINRSDEDTDRALYTIGKDGILWKLQRSNGRFLELFETIPQNIYQSIDRINGRLTYRQDILDANIDQPFTACPGIYGGHNWQAAAYDRPHHAIIIPVHQLCSDMVGRKVDMVTGGGGFGGDSKTYPMPGVGDMLGKLISIGLDPINEKWAYQQPAMFLTSALTTGGKLVFIGDLDRYFNAFDTETGRLLWQTRLPTALHGFPITYAVDGRQFIAVTTGMGVFRALTATASPDIYQPEGGNALYVFELP
jgi:alcohol dehydrogenase (cytochrome c)